MIYKVIRLSGTKTIVHSTHEFYLQIFFSSKLYFTKFVPICSLCSASQTCGSVDNNNQTFKFGFYHLFLFKLTEILIDWNQSNSGKVCFI